MCVLPASLLRGPARLRIGSGFGPLGSFSSSRRLGAPRGGPSTACRTARRSSARSARLGPAAGARRLATSQSGWPKTGCATRSRKSGASGRSARPTAAAHRRTGLGLDLRLQLGQARRSPPLPANICASRSRTVAASHRRSGTTATRSTSISSRCSGRWRWRTSRSRKSSGGALGCPALVSSASSRTKLRTTCSS